jgi:hypothetical protein
MPGGNNGILVIFITGSKKRKADREMHVRRGQRPARTLCMQNSQDNKGNAWGQQWHNSIVITGYLKIHTFTAKCTYARMQYLPSTGP